MAQGKKRSDERSQPSKMTAKVNLYCKECNSQVGIFNNEWLHLTPSYASPKEKGKNFGTRIGETTKKVPDGVVHKTAAGCEMAEVFCEGCNTHIGQHCKRAPESKKAHMVGQHFYKLSKTYLKCAKSAKAVDPVFVDEEEHGPSTPTKRHRTGAAADNARGSSPVSRPKTSPPQVRRTSNGDQHDGSARTPPNSSGADDQSVLVNRLAELERFVRNSGFAVPNVSSRPEPYAQPPPQHYGYPFAAPAPSSSQSDQIIEDQKKQIANITAQVDSLRGTIEDLRGVIHDLRAEKSRQQSASLQENAVMNRFEEMVKSVRDGQNNTAEADSLRAENKRLKERLSTIAGAMGLPNDGSEDESGSRNSLGKRKRDDEQPSRAAFRNSDSFNSNEGYHAPNGNDPFHPPTPESLQELMNGRVSTPAMRPVTNGQFYHPPHPQPQPGGYGAPPLRQQYSDPGLGQYTAPGPTYGNPYYSEGPYANPIERLARQDAHQYPPSGPARPESRLGGRAASMTNIRSSRNRGAEDGPAMMGDRVEFSDDEIATPAPGDAPLSVPRKRPAPPMFPRVEPTPNHRGIRMGHAFANPSNPGGTRGPFECQPPQHTPVQPQPYRPPPFPRPGTCTSLRQPAIAPGMDNALNFTPTEVAKRMHKNRPLRDFAVAGKTESTPAPAGRSGANSQDSSPIPIDPALEQLSRDNRTLVEIDNEQDNRRGGDTTEDEEPVSRPGRGNARNKRDGEPSTRRGQRKSDLERRDELAMDAMMLEEAA